MFKAQLKKFLKKYTPILLKPNVPQLLAEGRSWTAQLREAAREAENAATAVTQQISNLGAIRDSLNEEAAEGHEIANNFNDMLNTKKSLNK